ncbi:glycoside hydrolase family 97 catalytic domain-containing protein [Chitinophaga sp.]|uniref:glycoside hydrolase family 97 protein n=1 Tax=Chitinophaga sp. TaxID=1869181 RepID=UPI0031DF5484
MKYLFILMTIECASLFCNAQTVQSPDGNLKVVVHTGSQPSFSISYKGREVLPVSSLGVIRRDQSFAAGLQLDDVSEPEVIKDTYQMLTGKRMNCSNTGTQRIFKFSNSNHQHLNIVFRTYNDGVAFRYEFPDHSDSLVNVTGESTTYLLPDSTSRWMQPYTPAYEDFYSLNNNGAGSKDHEWGLPALYKVKNDSTWVLISEANMSEYNCGARLNNKEKPNEYVVTYPGARDSFKQVGVMTPLPWTSQWHTFIIGPLRNIVSSTLITDVSAPNKLKETDWIRPGAVSWIYWAYNHGSKDYKRTVEYIDFAKEMGWPYALIDWEWDVMTNGGNISDAIRYAASKGVKVLLWYNSGTSWLGATPADRLLDADKRRKEFTWLKEMGVSGIKVDFFAGDEQDMNKYYIELLKDAASYHLMVNFHGATVPRGWARTYPNLMTTEAVYGAEWYNNLPVLTDKAARHNTTLPFTRNVVGSMDYTPVTFSNSQHPHITSFGHELALSVVFESGFQHFADKPSSYDSLPPVPKDFLKHVPVTWDDTQLLDGYPGEKVVIARRKGKVWYIGGLNGKDTTQDLVINLDRIKKGKATLQIIMDGKDDHSFNVKNVSYTGKETLSIKCLPRGGFVAVVR